MTPTSGCGAREAISRGSTQPSGIGCRRPGSRFCSLASCRRSEEALSLEIARLQDDNARLQRELDRVNVLPVEVPVARIGSYLQPPVEYEPVDPYGEGDEEDR